MRNLNPVKKGKIEEERTENKGWDWGEKKKCKTKFYYEILIIS